MNWVIIGLLMLAIVGSMLWVMPSPRDRMQAALRQRAMSAGMQVQMKLLKFPRAIGESESEERHCFAYRMPRIVVEGESTASKKLPATQAFQIFKLSGHANTGLPQGWTWGKGEGTLSDEQLSVVHEVIAKLPDSALALESTPVATALYWREHGPAEIVDQIRENLTYMINKRI